MTCRIKEYKVTKCVHVRGADPFSKAIHCPEKERPGGGRAVQVWQQGCCVCPIEASAGGWDAGGGVDTGAGGSFLAEEGGLYIPKA